ncbi:MAG: tetratricopeptide repeat protein [Planctomycetaceae bacterium]|nr:tetratricopeptide repeat protein [Planctomycetaceae bacterium]
MAQVSPTHDELGEATGWLARLRALPRSGPELRSLWAKHHRKILVLITAWLGLTVTLIAVWQFAAAMQPKKKYIDLDTALAALERGDDARAIQIAGLFLPWNDLPGPRQWIPPYIFGVINSRRAEKLWGERGRQQHLLSARYLEEATARDMPDDYRLPTLVELGRQQIAAGFATRAIPNLLGVATSQQDSDLVTQANQLLAQAYSEAAKPDWQQALHHNSRVLADETVEGDDRELAQALQGRILFELGDLTAANQILNEIPEGSRYRAEALFWQARILARRDDDGRPEALQQAIDKFSRCILRDNWSSRWSPQAYLFRARAKRELSELANALEDLNQIARLYPESAVDLTAQFERATLLLDMKHFDDSLAAFAGFFEAMPRIDRWQNPYLSAQELRQAYSAAYDTLMQRADYARSFALARFADRLLGATEAAKLAEDAFQPWRTQQQGDLTGLTFEQLEARSTMLAERDRELAEFYERLSRRERASRDYPELIWNSAEHRRAAGDYPQALDLYTQYLDSFAKPRRTLGFLAVAECHLEMDQPQTALDVLAELADLPEADVSRARLPLVAARAHLMLANYDAASTELLKVIEGDQLTPTSIEWRTSLRLYARLLYDQQRYEQAAIRLEEWLTRYSQIEDSHEVRYLLAEAYRRAGEQVDPRFGNESTDERVQQLAREKARRRYEAALGAYDELADRMSRDEAQRRLSPEGERILRNTLFGRGSVLALLERHEQAVAAYLSAVHRYQDSPEVLDALLQIADCYRRMNRAIEARSTLLQARLVLQRLPNDAPFTETTNYSRDEWSQLIEALVAL